MFVYDRAMSRLPDPERLCAALAAARLEESSRISEAVQADRVVGVHGEAEVGKTQTIGQALAHCGLGAHGGGG